MTFDRKRLFAVLGPAFGLIATWILFALLAGAHFVDWSNQSLMLEQTSVVGCAAVGATLVIISGGIDLSVGSTIALGMVVIALFLEAGWPPLAAALGGIGATLLVGATIGAMVVGHIARVAGLVTGVCVGWWISKHTSTPLAIGGGTAIAFALSTLASRFAPRIPLSPFIATLGLWGALRGLAKGLGDNQPVYPKSIGWLADLMHPSASGFGAVLAPCVWILIAVAIVFAIVLRYTRFGRHVFAIGSNEETARLCGIEVERTKLMLYALAVGCAGIAAVLQLSYLSMGDPTTAEGYELKVIAAVVIGGASLSGGQGSVGGTLIGALIMTVVDNGCTKLGLDNWVQEVVTGAIIVAAVTLDRWRQRSAS